MFSVSLGIQVQHHKGNVLRKSAWKKHSSTKANLLIARKSKLDPEIVRFIRFSKAMDVEQRVVHTTILGFFPPWGEIWVWIGNVWKSTEKEWEGMRVRYLENKRQQFWFCCHMLSGNGQARPYLEWYKYDRLTITRQHMTAKPKLSSFILFLMHLI